MLNGSDKGALVSDRTQSFAVGGAPAPAPEEEGTGGAVAGARTGSSAPDRMQWIIVPVITLGSALAGGAAAWLVR